MLALEDVGEVTLVEKATANRDSGEVCLRSHQLRSVKHPERSRVARQGLAEMPVKRVRQIHAMNAGEVSKLIEHERLGPVLRHVLANGVQPTRRRWFPSAGDARQK